MRLSIANLQFYIGVIKGPYVRGSTSWAIKPLRTILEGASYCHY
jgi:hypothetical protein